jgi:PAS domain S-box-containing protein
MSYKILVVDDEESIRYTFATFLSDEGYQVATAESQAEALEKIEDSSFDVVFLDILLGRDSGILVLQECRQKQPNTPVVMVTGAPEIKTAAEAVRLGAFDYVTKPLHQDELLRHAKLAIEHKNLVDKQETYQLRMTAVFQSIQEAILIFDEEMKLVELNYAAKQMLACEDQLIGKSPEEIYTVFPALSVLQEMIDERCEGEIFRMEAVNMNGDPIVFGLTMAPLNGHDERELGTVLVLRDESQPVRKV